MSIASIFSTLNNWSDFSNNGTGQNSKAQFKQEMQQLGQDLQAGNLTAAQADFATIQKNEPQALVNAQSQNSTALGKDLNQLGQDLQAGNLSAAQQDFASVKQDIQQQMSQIRSHHHHHQSGFNSQEGQLFQQLGQDLQSGDLTSAQQVYATLQSDLGLATSTSSSSQASSGSGVSVTA